MPLSHLSALMKCASTHALCVYFHIGGFLIEHVIESIQSIKCIDFLLETETVLSAGLLLLLCRMHVRKEIFIIQI